MRYPGLVTSRIKGSPPSNVRGYLKHRLVLMCSRIVPLNTTNQNLHEDDAKHQPHCHKTNEVCHEQ